MNRYTAAQQIEWLSILQTAVHDYALAMRRAAAFGAMLAECDKTREVIEGERETDASVSLPY